jgi:hypothetical protein
MTGIMKKKRDQKAALLQNVLADFMAMEEINSRSASWSPTSLIFSCLITCHLRLVYLVEKDEKGSKFELNGSNSGNIPCVSDKWRYKL